VRTSQSQNLLRRVHDSRVGGNGSSQDIVCLGKVDDDDLALFVYFLSNANEAIGF